MVIYDYFEKVVVNMICVFVLLVTFLPIDINLNKLDLAMSL